ncbi:ABC transporter substrate-binding protein [Paenibacillus sanguinis]|uniref:ABC transporter substrate-binding protein n=1 Tax=Paenibacillus sanguinis TaxID=225906 RepID=UPI00037BAF71|nr:extracellular solute-binding protein [Paenibacillus sanguinis]
MKAASKKLTGSMFLVILAFAMLLTACGGSDKAEGGDAGGKEKGTELGIMWWGSQERHDATLEAMDLYSSEHPNITFTPQYTDWEGYWKKLPTLAASQSLPDILQMDAAYMQEYASRNVLAELSDSDLAEIIDKDLLELSKINGKLYGIPLSYNGTGLAYNKTELEEAGITLPVKDWTWEQFFEFALEAREKLPDGKYGIGDYTPIWDWYQAYQMSYDKGPLFKNGTELNIDKELWFKFQQTYADFREQNVVPDPQTMLSLVENDPVTDPIVSGKIMTRGVPVGSVGALNSMMPGKLALVNNPVGPAGGGWAQSTMYWSLSANSDNKEQSLEFLKWLVNDLESGKLLKTTRGIPINESVFDAIKGELTEGELMGVELYDIAIDKALPFSPAPSGWSDFIKTYEDTMTEVMFNKISLEKAYEIIVKKGEETTKSLSR